MGRLGPLNSLAFGRSPFQPPELDENGGFILGPHARDFDNKDFYIQQFDDRGHPKNDASKATTRAMQNAQNAVLETVGVVVRKEEASKSAWQRQSKKRKMEDIINENSHGIILRQVGPFILQSSMWWIISLRRRMQAFRSYLEPPILYMVRSELRTVGFVSFLMDGLLPAMASHVLNILLLNMESQKREAAYEITLWGTTYSWKPFNSFTTGLIIPLIVFPTKAFAVLQSLHLIPSTFHLGPLSFVPFTAASPIQIPQLSDSWSYNTGRAFVSSAVRHPLVVSTMSDMTKSYIHNALYRVILLTLAPRPDRPDKLTIKAAGRDREEDGNSFSLPGIGPENLTERLGQIRTNDFWTEVGTELGLLAARIKELGIYATWLKPSHKIAELDAEEAKVPIPRLNDAQVRARSEALQREWVWADIDNLRDNEDERLRTQGRAHAWALAELGIPTGSAVGIDAFILPAYEIFDSHSTPTPEPVDLSEEVTQMPYLEEPPLLFDPLTSDNIYDRQEREGEGRVMASMASSEPDEPSSRSELSPLPNLRNASQPSGDPLGQNVIADASLYVTEDHLSRRVLILPTGSEVQTNSSNEVSAAPVGQPISVVRASEDLLFNPSPSDVEDRVPEAPESPLERNATPPAISRNRAGDTSPPFWSIPSSISSMSESTLSSIEDAEDRQRRARTRPARPRPRPRRVPVFPAYNSLSSDDGTAHDRTPLPRHRVTTLSLFPAEMFAECLAGLITSIVTLPLDTLYVRSLVHGFLSCPSDRPGGSAAALGLRTDVYGMNEWFGGGATGWNGRLRYTGLLALTLGMQGCVSSLSWALVTRLAITTGKQSGWGQL